MHRMHQALSVPQPLITTEAENIFFLINKAADRELALHLGESVPLLITSLQISCLTTWKQLSLSLPWFPTKKKKQPECDEDARSFRLETAAMRPLKSLSHAEQALLRSWVLLCPTLTASPPGTPFTLRSKSWIWSWWTRGREHYIHFRSIS